jgi:protein-tyrosine phosphatase
MVRVLFVCLGNICRSPMAEGVFRKLVEEAGYAEHIEVDSAGTHAYHTQEPPDPRAREAAARRGVDISHLRGRQATAEDLVRFDYVLAMDHENYANLRALCPTGHEHKLRLFLEYAVTATERAVPDPYFGGVSVLNRVLVLMVDAAEGLLVDVRTRIDSKK